jgi:D-tyrosyl-tRNA(Tyr) deacylase
VAQARGLHPEVQTGQFAADMKVHLVNDGPVTIPLRIDPVSQSAIDGAKG